MNAKELAAEYSRIHNEAVAKYRAIFRREGLKMKGNPGCDGATYADYTMFPANEVFVAEYIGRADRRKLYSEIKHPQHLLDTAFSLIHGAMFDRTHESYVRILAEMEAIHSPLQREWTLKFA